MSKTKKRNSSRKGDYGYLASKKKRRILITAVLFAVPLLIFFSAMLYFHTLFLFQEDYYLDCDSCCRLPSSLQISGQPDHDLSRQTSRNICIP